MLFEREQSFLEKYCIIPLQRLSFEFEIINHFFSFKYIYSIASKNTSLTLRSYLISIIRDNARIKSIPSHFNEKSEVLPMGTILSIPLGVLSEMNLFNSTLLIP